MMQQPAHLSSAAGPHGELHHRVQVLESTVQFLQQQLMITQNTVQELTQQMKSLTNPQSSISSTMTSTTNPTSLPIPPRASVVRSPVDELPPLESASNLLNSTPVVSAAPVAAVAVVKPKKKRPAASPAIAPVAPKAAALAKIATATPAAAFVIPSLFDDMDEDSTIPLARPALRAQNSASSTTSTKGSRTNTPVLTANASVSIPSFPTTLAVAAIPAASPSSTSSNVNGEPVTVTEEKAQTAGSKRKRVEPSTASSLSSPALAATSSVAASSSDAIIPSLPAPIVSTPAFQSQQSQPSLQLQQPPQPSQPEAGRYDDPSLIDVADYNRDLDTMDSDELLSSAPQSYRMMVALEKELRLVEEEYENRRLAPLQPSKRPRLGLGDDDSTTSTTSNSSLLSRNIESALASERECAQFSEVYEVKLDASAGRTIVLAGPPVGEAESYTRSSAQWIMPTQLDVFSAPNYLPPRSLYRRLKLHQLQAVNFILGNLLGRYNPENEATGCILADALGLGKSLSTLCALQCYAQITMDQKLQLAKQLGRTPSSVQAPCFLLVCPPTVLKHWLNEVNKLNGWLSQSEFNPIELTGTTSTNRKWLSPTFSLDATVPQDEREAILKNWKEQKGILFIGYDLLREIITSANAVGVTPTTVSPAPAVGAAPMIIDERGDVESEDEDVMDLTGDAPVPALSPEPSSAGAGSLISYFQNSPPDALVLDEGHRIRNLYSGLHQALARAIPTRARVILSGYPLQNALSELYAMIDFVRPPHLSQGHSLGSHRDFQKFFEIPILKAQSSSNIMVRRKARRRCWMLFDLMSRLHLMLRRSNSVLVTQLHIPLHEIVLVLRFSKEQLRIYNEVLLTCKQNLGRDQWRVLDLVSFVSMLLSHPQILKQHVLESAAEIGNSQSADDQARTSVQVKKAFIERVLPNSSPFDLLSHHSPKMFLLLQTILKCKEVGDKVLVFSKWISTLNFIESLFQSHNRVIDSLLLTQQDQIMRAGERIRYGRFDGTTPQSERQKWIKQFGPLQDGDSATTSSQEVIPDVLLISTGCGEGINLCRANRVILLDVSWNPNADLQASHRIFRFGQTKPCFIYRFIIGHSMEEKVFLKQIKKEELSKWSLERKTVNRNVGLTAPASSESTPMITAPASAPTSIEAPKSSAEDDPTNIKRFFDSPPSISDMLKQPASIQLNLSIVNDPVTKQLLDQFSCSGRSKSSVDISTGEPNSWILSAFEQHSLMEEDDASTTGIFGDERPSTGPAVPASTLSSALLPTATASPRLPANQMSRDIIVPIPVSAAAHAPTTSLISTSNSNLASSTTGVTSSVSTNSAPSHPPSNPVYWFGAVPAGVTLVKSSSSSGSASSSSKAAASSTLTSTPIPALSQTISASSFATAVTSSSSSSSSSTVSTHGSTFAPIRPSTPPSISVPIPRLSPPPASASTSSVSTSVISSAIRSGPAQSSLSTVVSSNAPSHKETDKDRASSTSASASAQNVHPNTSRTPDVASFPVLSGQLSHSREKMAQLSDSRKARRQAEEKAAADEKERIEREAREKAQHEADRRERERAMQRERDEWRRGNDSHRRGNNGRSYNNERNHERKQSPHSRSHQHSPHRPPSNGHSHYNQKNDSRSSSYQQQHHRSSPHQSSSSRRSPTQKHHRSVSPAQKSKGNHNGQNHHSNYGQPTPPKITHSSSSQPRPYSPASDRVTAVVAHPPASKPTSSTAPTSSTPAAPRSIAEQKLELYQQRAGAQP